MHVPDGFINVQVSAATGLLSFGTLWAYIRSAKNLIADKFIALTGKPVKIRRFRYFRPPASID